MASPPILNLKSCFSPRELALLEENIDLKRIQRFLQRSIKLSYRYVNEIDPNLPFQDKIEMKLDQCHAEILLNLLRDRQLRS